MILMQQDIRERTQTILEMKVETKAQSTIEFVLLTMVLFLFFVFFLSFSSTQLINTARQHEFDLLKKNVEIVGNEVALAASQKDGYERNFSIAETIAGSSYDITQNGKSLMFSTDDYSYSINLAVEINGTIQKGENRIRKSNGVVYVNK